MIIKSKAMSRKNKGFCSNSCSTTYYMHLEEHKNKIAKAVSATLKEKASLGLPVGWMQRKKNTRSYPEKFFEDVFKNNNIKFQSEVKCGKYFIDFVVNKIAIEIDGRQHIYRKDSDDKKDDYLKSLGYTVHRIPWKNINKESGSLYIKEQIDILLKLIGE